MQDYKEKIEFEKILAEERPRLVRLCAWFSGNPGVAEDLAQETLLAAWRSQDQLVSLEKLKPWTSAIARNVCLHWSRRHYREQAHVAHELDSEDRWEEQLADDTSLELELDRYELAQLLDQALSLLPPGTAQMLVEHYLKETSHAEIAAMMRMKPGAVAVRLQRGKLALQRLLRTNLQAQSSGLGLVDQTGSQWETTNIWCPGCGQARLLGMFRKDEIFALRCPACHPEPESIMAGLDLTKPYHARLLGQTRMYKPAYARLLTSFAPLYHQALKSHTAPCLACGQGVVVRVEHARTTDAYSNVSGQVILYCPACGWTSNKALSGLVMSSPEAQRFWREHPRIRLLPVQEIDSQGSPALLTRLQSVSDAAELVVISRRDTFELVEAHTNVKL